MGWQPGVKIKMKFLFPLPITYDGNESRYLQRDGARFAEELARRGHVGVKIVINEESGRSAPTSPFLAIATWSEWCSADFWRNTNADGILLYGGISRHLLPVANSIKTAGIPLFLKMDSAFGIIPKWHSDFLHRLRATYYIARQHHGVTASIVISMLKMTKSGLAPGTSFIKEYLSLFDIITVESEYARKNTHDWLVRQDIKHAAKRVKTLLHPIPDSFSFSQSSAAKDKTILAVAQNWSNPLKGGSLLAKTLAIALSKRGDYKAVIVGGGSESIKRIAVSSATGGELENRISVIPKIAATDTQPLYSSSRILITTSGYESGPIVAYEAACCGCSVVFPPTLKHLSFFGVANAGKMSERRTPTSLADALLDECDKWDAGSRNPMTISGWCAEQSHTSAVTDKLVDWLANNNTATDSQ